MKTRDRGGENRNADLRHTKEKRERREGNWGSEETKDGISSGGGQKGTRAVEPVGGVIERTGRMDGLIAGVPERGGDAPWHALVFKKHRTRRGKKGNKNRQA